MASTDSGAVMPDPPVPSTNPSTDSTAVMPDSPVPTITPNTHIIALLGPDNADPTNDGWFSADFCLLNQLFAGLGKSQRWYTSVNLASAIEKHGPILHGNPRRSRRVVCSNATQLHGLCQLPEDSLKHGWLSAITSVCQSIDAAEHLLLIFLGHGSDKDDEFRFQIGDADVHRQEVVQVIKASRASSGGADEPKVTFLMTSCFSGGWAMDTMEGMNRTLIAAAHHDEFSNSTSRSASGSFRGGILVEALANELARSSPSPDAHGLPRSFREWTSDLDAEMDRLFSVGARPQFAAKEGSWDDPFTEVTGIQQTTYQERYMSLSEVPPNPEMGSTEERVAASHSIVSGRIINLCRQYMAIRPGLDEASNNVNLHSLIHQFIDWRTGRSSIPLPDDKMVFLTSRMRHRMTLSLIAEMYVDRLGLRPFRTFNTFVLHEWKEDASSQRKQAYEVAMQQIPRRWIFPNGPMARFEIFLKPQHYLAAAFADKGLDQMEVSRRVSVLCKEIEVIFGSQATEPHRQYPDWRERLS